MIMENDLTYLKERVMMFGNYIAENGATVRQTAQKFGYSKSTVHKDVSERLRDFSPSLYEEASAVLAKNKAERHLRGGMATKRKYEARIKDEN